MTIFRVHTTEGQFDIKSADAKSAADAIRKKYPSAIILKTKVLKEKADG